VAARGEKGPGRQIAPRPLRDMGSKRQFDHGRRWVDAAGARPRSLSALLKEGRKLEEFAIQPASSARKQVAAKRGRPAKKRGAKK
jgi:hypothetical protein